MASEISKESSLKAPPTPCTESNDVAREDSECQSVLTPRDNESSKGVMEKGLDNSEALTDARNSDITGDDSALLLMSLDDEAGTCQRRQRSASHGIIDNATTTKKVLNIWRKRAASSASLTGVLPMT